jgi:hypothetical protein
VLRYLIFLCPIFPLSLNPSLATTLAGRPANVAFDKEAYT